MNVRGRPSPNLDCMVIEGQVVLFDPALVDTDLPPSENGSVIRSDVAVSLEDMR